LFVLLNPFSFSTRNEVAGLFLLLEKDANRPKKWPERQLLKMSVNKRTTKIRPLSLPLALWVFDLLARVEN